MKAAVLTAFRQPLEIRDLPDPAPGPDDAVIRVEACGVCRSDWHVWQQDFTWIGIQVQLPRVMGHEFGGVVVDVGRNVRNFKRGDHITVPFHLACGKCEYCFTGRSNLCFAFGVIGIHHDGGYGSLCKVPNADATLVPLPEGIDSLTAAALGCRFMTAYHGIAEQADTAPGEWVAVFGIGGVGISAVQIAAALGAQVIAVGRSADKLERARQEGAVATVRAGASASAEIIEITKGGAHVTVDALGAAETTLAGIAALRKGGRHVQLGLTGAREAGSIPLPVDVIVNKEIRFIGSVGCPTTSYPGLLSLTASGKLAPKRLVGQRISVGDVNSVLTSMTDYRSRGFSIIDNWAVSSAGRASA